MADANKNQTPPGSSPGLKSSNPGLVTRTTPASLGNIANKAAARRSAAVTAAAGRVAAPRVAAPNAAGSKANQAPTTSIDDIDVWLAARMGELRHAEERLAQREQKIAAASAGLAKLFEGIKHQVIQAELARRAITETHHNAVKWFEQVAQEHEGRLTSVEANWAQRITKLEDVDAQIDTWVSDIEDRAAQIVKPVQQRLEASIGDMHALVIEAVEQSEEAIRKRIDAAVDKATDQGIDAFATQAEEAAELVQKKLERSLESTGDTSKGMLAELSTARSEAQAWVETFMENLADRMQSISATMEQQGDNQLDRLEKQIKDRIEHAAEAFEARAEKAQDHLKLLDGDLDERVRATLHEAEEELKRTIEAGEAALQRAVASSQEAVRKQETSLQESVAKAQQMLRDAVAEAQRAGDNAALPITERITAAIAQAEAEVDARIEAQTARSAGVADELSSAVDAGIARVKAQIAAAQVAVDEQVSRADAAAEDVRVRSEQACTAMLDHTHEAELAAKMRAGQLNDALQSRMDQIIKEAEGRVRMMRDAMNKSVDDAVESARVRMTEQVSQLRGSATAAVEPVMTQLSQRISSFREQMRGALEDCDASLGDKLQALQDKAATQQSGSVNAMRRELDKHVQQIQAQMTEQLTRFEQETADALTHLDMSIERRIKQIGADGEVRARKVLKPIAELVADEVDAASDAARQRQQAGSAKARRAAAAEVRGVRQAMRKAVESLQRHRAAVASQLEASATAVEGKWQQQLDAMSSQLHTAADALERELVARAAAMKPLAEAAANEAAEALDSRARELHADAAKTIKPLIAALDAQFAEVRARGEQVMKQATERSAQASAMLTKIDDAKLDLTPELVEELDTAASLSRTLVARLESQTRHSAEVAAKMESLTRAVVRLGAADPDADTMDLEAGTPLWLENAERMLHDLEKSLATSRRTLESLEAARNEAQQAQSDLETASASQRAGKQFVPVVGDEDEPRVAGDGGTSLAEAMMIVARQAGTTTLDPKAIEAAVKSVESMKQLTDEVVTDASPAPKKKPGKGTKAAIDHYAEDLRRRIEEARKAR